MVFKLNFKRRRSQEKQQPILPTASSSKQSLPETTAALSIDEKVHHHHHHHHHPPPPAAHALRRQCGWYERLFVSTSNTGEPLYATYVARIEKSFDEVHAATTKRAQELIDKVALLSAHVGDSKTRHPYFEVSQRRTPADVIFTQTALNACRDQIREDVHTRAVRHAQDTFNIEQGRMWNVGLWKAAPEQEQQDVVYLSLTILHLASDGLGGRFLFEALISPTMPEHITFLPGLPPTLEHTVGYKLQGKMIRHLVWIAFSFLMPKPIRYRMTWAPHWPLKIDRHPSTQETARKIITLDGAVVPYLKEAAKAHGLGTINPVISIAALAALFSVTAPEDKPTSNKRLPFHLALETPIALREPEKLKHSSCAGNFSGAHLHQAQLRRTTSFWEHAREYAESIKACDANSSLQFLAMAKLVPDPKSYKGTDQAPTPWEAYVLSEMKKPQPFRSSLDLVNLGAMRGPKNGRVSEISVSGTIDQVYSAFMLVCASFLSSDPEFPSHMVLTLSWRQGCLPDALVSTFLSNIRKMLTLIFDGRVGEAATFGEVAEMLREPGLREWAAPDFEATKLAARAKAAAAAAAAQSAEVIPTVIATSSLTPPSATVEEVLLGTASPAPSSSPSSPTLSEIQPVPLPASLPPILPTAAAGGGKMSKADVLAAASALLGVSDDKDGLILKSADSSLSSSSSSSAGGTAKLAAGAVMGAAGVQGGGGGGGPLTPGLVEKVELDVGGGHQVLVPVLASGGPGYQA
ncbi:hypothetical protein OC842_000801 [Tilletia horrida]|uniref:Uncharacterized protein n=1 Tax=Tilletia horrida TaxID=155126 RepID=A0AAN6GG64_9BASI|nr:hypothetical protein OC842_000801 [Tilletia horrida]